MGLASALSTALTGMSAGETTIGVVGNNLANASTVGFKASTAEFSTQFLQTQSLGSAPTDSSGGTNPTQVGLGTQVAEISQDFSQGTVQVSSNPSDLAIQGDGFFMVQGTTGETLYTRNGSFQTNSQNQLVTINGNRVLGYTVDGNYVLQTTQLAPLTIPLGSSAVAQATQNAVFQGTLTPTGDVATTAGIIQSGILGDGQYTAPPAGADVTSSLAPVVTSTTGAASGAGPLGPGTYEYAIVNVDAQGNESPPSTVTVTLAAGSSGIDLSNLPTDSTGNYVGRRIYRSVELSTLPAGATPTFYLDKDLSTDNTTTDLATSALGTDTTSDATLVTHPALNTTSLTGNYSYYVTWVAPDGTESRPSPAIGPQNITNGRIELSNLPAPSGAFAGGTIRVYRNLASDSSSFFRVADLSPGQSFTDDVPDSTLTNAAAPGHEALDYNGPKINVSTLLTNVLQLDGTNYDHVFQTGTLSFTGDKGDRALATQSLKITSTTTVQNLIEFMNQAMGIQPASADPTNPIPGDSSGKSAGGSVTSSGQLQFVSNNGVDNAVSIPLSSFTLMPSSGGAAVTPNLNFNSTQTAVGQSASADFIAYDSLGIPVNVRVTVDMESHSGNSTTYRWIADSPDNQPASGSSISVGTGLITFDGQGNVVSVDNDTVSIGRTNVSSVSPLQFKLDFSQLSGLAASTSTLAVARQDGSSAGTLSSFSIGADGVISGVFSNGISRTLGQVELARFANPTGLVQSGSNLFAAGSNSGLPVKGTPGQQGIGSITAGATELSNTDVGKNLIDLILASTQYRSNAQVVTTTQQLFQDLLTLTR